MNKTVKLGLLAVLGCTMIFSSGCGRSNRSDNIKCINNLKIYGLGIMMYIDDNGDKYPDDLAAVSKYTDKFADSCRAGKTKYVYFGGKLTVKSLKDSAKTPIMICYNNHAANCNVLFADGHVESLMLKQKKFSSCRDAVKNVIDHIGLKDLQTVEMLLNNADKADHK